MKSTRQLRRLAFFPCIIMGMLILLPSPMLATEEFSLASGKECGHCHLDENGGGELTAAGAGYLAFLEAAETGQTGSGIFSLGSPVGRLTRLLMGYLHFVTAVFWFGTILYVHIVLKPAYAAGGLPRGEVRVGLVSMAVMAATGVVLTFYRLSSFTDLFSTRFGVLLAIKIAIFLAMAGSALLVVLVIGPRLRRAATQRPTISAGGDLTAQDLAACTGQNGQPALVAFQGGLYDVSASKLWKEGNHFRKHQAGADLTSVLAQAPHGEEKILAMPRVGNLLPDAARKIPARERLFYAMAYFNLANVFLIILILALWRWW